MCFSSERTSTLRLARARTTRDRNYALLVPALGSAFAAAFLGMPDAGAAEPAGQKARIVSVEPTVFLVRETDELRQQAEIVFENSADGTELVLQVKSGSITVMSDAGSSRKMEKR